MSGAAVETFGDRQYQYLPVKAPVDMGFVVATYNIRHQVLDEGPNAWQNRRDAVFERLRTLSPDIVGLQESTGEQQEDIERALDYRWYGVAEEPGSGEHNPIGVDSRFRSREAATEWLSSTPDIESVGWDAAYPRVLTRVLLEDTVTGGSLAVFNTHFDHRGSDARAQSARQIRTRVDSLPATAEAVVLGDFNSRPGSEPYDILTGDEGQRQLGDARTLAPTVDGPTTTVTDFETTDPGRRLDHIFVTPGLAVDSYWIDDCAVDGRYPSDHLPVVARMKFTR